MYTLWQTAGAGFLLFAAIHCWVGDLLIASFSLALGIIVAGRGWPSRRYVQTAAIAVLSGLSATIFLEWLNVTIRGSWAYAAAMPRVPPFGTGLSPLLQWIVVPVAAFAWARRGIIAPKHAWLVLGLACALAVPGGYTRAATSAWASNTHGAARLVTATEATGSGTQLDVGLQLRLTPGWHTYWRTPGDAGIAPTIDWTGSENVAAAAIAWPAPQRLPSLGDLETQGYMDGVVLPIAVTLAQPGAALHLHAEVDYASCKEVCIPYHASLDLILPPGLAWSGPEAPLIAAAEARVPGDLGAARLELLGVEIGSGRNGAVLSVRLASSGLPLHAPDLFVEGIANGSPGRPEVELAEGVVWRRCACRSGTCWPGRWRAGNCI